MVARQLIHTVRRRERLGAAMLECAVALPVMFFLLFTILDLGIAATRYNALADGSRRIAREAILHGSLTPPHSAAWGPAEYAGNAADGSTYMESVRGVLPTMPPNLVKVRISWPDADNSPRDRVQVELMFEHKPLIPGWAGREAIHLRSLTTMRIVN
jgi:hypothetical protein